MYVDDILILTRAKSEQDAIAGELGKVYEVRIAEDVKLSLEVQIISEHDSDQIFPSVSLRQISYIGSILRRFGLEKCKPECTPIVESIPVRRSVESDNSVLDVDLYRADDWLSALSSTNIQN